MSRRCGGMAFSAPRPAPPHPPPRDGAEPAAGEACIVADASTGAVAVTAGGRDLLRVEAGLLKGERGQRQGRHSARRTLSDVVSLQRGSACAAQRTYIQTL